MPIEFEIYDITIDGTPWKFKNRDEWYEKTVEDVILAISYTQIGKLVLNRIKTSKGEVGIYPRYENGRNAESAGKLDKSGRGTVADKGLVWYSPDQWAKNQSMYEVEMPTNLRAFDPANLRDEVLFHELVHAGRRLDGIRVAGVATTGAAAPYENEEEFAAILYTNIYLSEKKKKVFRGSHGGTSDPNDKHVILSEEQSSTYGFLTVKENYDLVKKICDTDRLAPAISDINTPFNPIHGYYNRDPSLDYPMPQREVAFETVPPPSDDYLASLMAPRYLNTDMVRYGRQVNALEKAIGSLKSTEAAGLLARLNARAAGDKVATLFHHNFSAPARLKLMELLRKRAAAT